MPEAKVALNISYRSLIDCWWVASVESLAMPLRPDWVYALCAGKLPVMGQIFLSREVPQ
jgi:hypothetical protein